MPDLYHTHATVYLSSRKTKLFYYLKMCFFQICRLVVNVQLVKRFEDHLLNKLC